MNEATFRTEMAKTAVVTRTDLDELTYAAYWDDLADWHDDQFIGAMQACRLELKRFPTLAHIIERKPIRELPKITAEPEVRLPWTEADQKEFWENFEQGRREGLALMAGTVDDRKRYWNDQQERRKREIAIRDQNG